MRVIYVGPLPPQLGGAPTTSWLLLKQLSLTGWRIRAVGPSTAETMAECQALSREHPEIAFHRYQIASFPEDPSQTRPDAERLDEEQQIAALVDRLAAAERPDLILAGREVECRAIPAVATAHRLPWVLRSGGYVLHLLEQGWLRSVPPATLRYAMSHAEATIIQAEHLIAPAQAAGCRRISVIPSPLDLSRFHPRPRPAALCRQLQIPLDAPVVLHASNLKPVKRAEDVVESAVSVLAQNKDAVYVIAGDGPGRGLMEERSRQFGLTHRFRFIDRVDYSRMPDLFALANVVLMPSAFEQQARVYIETQASGRVLIASDVAGAKSVVEDGVTGLLFPCGDVTALANATLRALSDPAWCDAIGQRAHVRVQAHSLEVIAARMTALMQDVVRSYRPAHA